MCSFPLQVPVAFFRRCASGEAKRVTTTTKGVLLFGSRRRRVWATWFGREEEVDSKASFLFYSSFWS